MGYTNALGIAETDLPLEQQVRWHLRSNCYPPVPEALVPVAVDAIMAFNGGDPLAEIAFPEGVTFKGHETAPAYDIIVSLYLEAFTSDEVFE